MIYTVIAKRSLRGRSPRFSRGVRGHAPPENFENQVCEIHIFFNVLVNDSAHLLQEKIGLKYRKSFLCSEENDRRMSYLRFSIWLFCCVRLTTSTHDIDFKFSGLKGCNKTRLKT